MVFFTAQVGFCGLLVQFGASRAFVASIFVRFARATVGGIVVITVFVITYRADVAFDWFQVFARELLDASLEMPFGFQKLAAFGGCCF